jgi:FkbM family methyltransferase
VLERLRVDLVVDVGANTGQYAKRLRAHGYQGKILSFEPMSREYSELVAATVSDRSWTAERLGLGAEAGELQIIIAGNSISSSMLPMLARHEVSAPDSQYVGSEMVPVARLDEVAREAVAEASAPHLKIDTQVYEASVLDGATALLDLIVSVELEMSLVPLYEGQELLGEMWERMIRQGFSLSTLSPGMMDSESGETLQIDGIFVRP